VTRALVDGWRRRTAATARVAPCAGPHLWPLAPAHKASWLVELVREARAAIVGVGGVAA